MDHPFSVYIVDSFSSLFAPTQLLVKGDTGIRCDVFAQISIWRILQYQAMFVQSLRVDDPRMVSKYSQKLGLYFETFTIAGYAWIFQNCRLVNETDETFAAMTNNAGDARGIILMNLNNRDVGNVICGCRGNLLYS